MRTVLLLTMVFCVGCVSKKTPEFVPAHSRKIAIKLSDSLGIMTMYMPERYDTGFSWLHHTDCTSCDEMKCRFQSKLSRIYMEDGAFWSHASPKDSVDQLTIIYSPHTEAPPKGGGWIYDTTGMYESKSFSDYRKEDIKHSMGRILLVLDTTYKIYDRPLFAVGTYEYDPGTKKYIYLVKAETSAWSRTIEFQFKLIRNIKDSVGIHFIENSAEILQSVRLYVPPFFGR